MSASTGPCAGLRIVDFSISYPGALASMVLADAGAEVIKVEPPAGDPTRGHYASVMWHRGKRSVVLDLKTSQGAADARGLIATADVLLDTFRPGVAERLGLAYEALAKGNPGLVHCSITGFGAKGPLANLKGYEGIVGAAVGRMDLFSIMVKKGGPIYASLPLASYGAAMLGVHGIMAALLVRAKTGRGQKVDTSLVQALTCYDLMGAMGWQLAQRGGQPVPRGYPGSTVPPYMAARTKDGYWLQFGNLTVGTLYNFLDALGLAHLLKDPRYKNMPTFADPKHLAEAHRMCIEKVLQRDRDDWMRLFMEIDVACEPFRTTQEGLCHEQVVYNGNVIERRHPTLGAVKQLGPLARFSATPMEPGWPPPAAGEHTREVLSAPQKPRRSSAASAPWPKHPLTGVTVLEFATYIAVPFMASLMADMGARVIKVEPITGDLARGGNWPKMCKTFQGKEGFSLDLKDPRCQEALHRLVGKTDVVIHNYRPGVPQRLGLDYETLRRINPRLVYIYGGFYGSTGPHSHRAGFHPIAGAIAGSPRFQLGRKLPPPPDKALTLDEVQSIATSMQRSNETNPDVVSALANTSAALMALHARERTGEGQYVETWMINSNLYANADDAISYEGKPERMLADEDYNGPHALYRLYRARKGWVFLACPQDKEWPVLARAAGLGGLLDDPRFAAREARLQNDRALADLLEKALGARTASEWEATLTAQDIACVQVADMDFGEYLNVMPWVKEAGHMVEAEHASLGRYWRHGAPYNFSHVSCRPGPNLYLGEHTRPILRELGYDDQAISTLEREGVIVCKDGGRP